MKKLLTFVSAGIFALAILVIVPGISTADAAAFMKIGDIKGEATDKDHKDWIVIQSMSSPLTKATARSGRVDNPLVIIKTFDKASPKLQEALNSGERFSEVIISVGDQKGRKTTYLKYKLTDVMVTSYSASSGDGVDRPTEEVAFYYNKIEFVYKEQDETNREKERKKE